MSNKFDHTQVSMGARHVGHLDKPQTYPIGSFTVMTEKKCIAIFPVLEDAKLCALTYSIMEKMVQRRWGVLPRGDKFVAVDASGNDLKDDSGQPFLSDDPFSCITAAAKHERIKASARKITIEG
jgi:hypothetical protein